MADRLVATPGRAPLPGLALIRVDGPDATAFLQGQLTSDVAALASGHWQWTGYCSPKGRLLAVGRLMRAADALYLQVPDGLRDDLLSRLRRFVLRSKVTLLPVAADWQACALWGDAAVTTATMAFGAGAADDRTALSRPGAILLRIADDHAQLYLDPAGLPDLAAAVAVVPASTASWEASDLRAGIPWIVAATQDAFVPQMVDLDVIDGVSFAKGCYPGQEIVARSRYLGEVKRRLHFARCAAPLDPGTSLEADGHAVGKVLASVSCDDGGFDLLAVIDGDAASAGPVVVAGTGGAVTQVRRVRPAAPAS